jgi:hypothetical protein
MMWRTRRRSFHGLSLSIVPPYLGNTHGPVDKVRNRHGAELKEPALGTAVARL